MFKILKYIAIAFAAFCTILVVYGVGSGFMKSRQKHQLEDALSSGMPRDVWLSRFRPIELAGQCTDSPVQRSLQGQGDYQACIGVVGPIFDRCASGQIFEIPNTLGSRAEAERFGALIGECITAHHFGGSHLDAFRAALQKSAKA